MIDFSHLIICDLCLLCVVKKIKDAGRRLTDSVVNAPEKKT